jgi:predicted alpha/beta-fold hydrolase
VKILYLQQIKGSKQRSGRAAAAEHLDPVAVSRTEGRSMRDLGERLREIPFSPQGLHLVNLASSSRPDLSRLGQYVRGNRAGSAYPYPEGFEKVVFPSLDGTPLVGVMGLHRDGRKRPGVVFCHGFLGSKSKPYIVEAALQAFGAWDYNVFALDLRNFGESQKLSHAPTTGGWKEGQDVLAACRFLGGMEEVSSVAAVGYSLGAGAVMNAAWQCKRYPYITGGALGWSGYASMEQMTSHISRRPPLDDPFFPIYAVFLFLAEMRRLELRRQLRKEEGGDNPALRPLSSDYRSYVREIAAPHYGMSEEELFALSSPAGFIGEVEVPLMLVHAQDDPVCPIEEIEELRNGAAGNPNVDVWVLPTGSHCAFKGYDEDWYWSVMRGFLDYWAERPAESGFDPGQAREAPGAGGKPRDRMAV